MDKDADVDIDIKLRNQDTSDPKEQIQTKEQQSSDKQNDLFGNILNREQKHKNSLTDENATRLKTNTNSIIRQIEKMKFNHSNDFTGETGMAEGHISTKKLKKFIVRDIIQPAFVKDIRDTIKGRYKWRKIAGILFVIARIMFLANVILSFVSAYLTRNEFSFIGFIGASIGAVGLLIGQYGTTAMAESRKKNNEANELLRQLGVEGIPDILREEVNTVIGADGKPVTTFESAVPASDSITIPMEMYKEIIL